MYALVLPPAITVWLAGEEFRAKSWTISGIAMEWVGVPDPSAAVTLMLYVPAAALAGRLTVATTGTVDPAPTIIGFTGVTEQLDPGGEPTVQAELTLLL